MEPLVLKILDGALPPIDFCEKELLSNALFISFMDKIDKSNGEQRFSGSTESDIIQI